MLQYVSQSLSGTIAPHLILISKQHPGQTGGCSTVGIITAGYIHAFLYLWFYTSQSLVTRMLRWEMISWNG
jgi:hypothetical protein